MSELKIGTKVDKFLKLKKEISANEKAHNDKQKIIKAKADELELDIIKTLKADKLDKVEGKIGSVKYKKDPLPSAEDWQALYKYIKKENAFFLLQKRVSTSAYKELIEAGVKVPGLKTFYKESLGTSMKRGL